MPLSTEKDVTHIYALAEGVFSLLSQLRSPIHCGHAFAIAQARMVVESGLTTEQEVRTVMQTMTREVLKNFAEIMRDHNH
jgi:hypothetical protein